MTDEPLTRASLRLRLQPLRDAALRGEGGIEHARAVADAYDELLRDRFARSLAEVKRPRGRVSLLAVGGYGRRTLALGSDLDVILLGEGDARALDALSERLLHPLWDAGVTVGHATRTIPECIALARHDLRSATVLLDARHVAGDEALSAELVARGAKPVFDGDLPGLLDALEAEMRERHARYGATVYLLEPDVKHGRGALRDLDIARWALQARYRARGYTEALQVGAITAAERDALDGAQAFLWRVRGAMHAAAWRRVDRLTFDAQEEVSAALGFVDPTLRRDDPARATAEAVERMMSEAYQHAVEVARLLPTLLDRCRPARQYGDHPPRSHLLADDIARFDGCVALAHHDALAREPCVALRLFEVALSHKLPLAHATRAHVAAAARDPSWCETLRDDPRAARIFLRLLTRSAPATLRPGGTESVSETPDNRGSVLAELHDLGLLLAMVPEFATVTARVQHDIYHVYTVDVHSVAAVDRLHAMARGELGEDFAPSAERVADLDRREILCVATLLHDIGKRRGGDHSVVGAVMARDIAARLGLAPDDAESVAWLVREHLTLYHLATRRDVSDPATLARIHETFADPWRLRALYLLTVADLSSTSPTAMTQWKSRLLDEFYRRADESLRATPATDARRAALTAQALDLCPPDERPRVIAWCAAMPERYVRATAPAAILRHARALGGAAPGDVVVRVTALDDDPSGTLGEVLVRAPDRPGLLARLAALLYAHRLDVQSAEIHSTGGDVVDVFAVRAASEMARVAARTGPGLETRLRELLDGRLDPDALVRTMRGAPGIPRPEPAVGVKVHVLDEASERATVVEVFGRDRPGFLYDVTRTLHALGLSVVVARVNTEGRRVADVFYVTQSDGAKVAAEARPTVETALRAAVEGVSADGRDKVTSATS